MIEIIPFSKIDSGEWDAFCLNSPSAWFHHTSQWLSFAKIISNNPGVRGENISFGILNNRRLQAIAPLIIQPIEKEMGLKEFAMAGISIPSPAFLNEITDSQRKKLLKIIFQEIDWRAKEQNVSYARFFINPLTEEALEKKSFYNPLLRFGFNETSLSTNIIDLSFSEKEIWRKMRKGHQADILAAQKNNFKVEFFFGAKLSSENFGIYRNLHCLAAGRKTGSDEKWQAMFDFIKEKYSVLGLEKEPKNNSFISGAIIFVFKNKAYYASQATHPEHDKERGVGHLLQWEIIKFLKTRNYSHYELGWNVYPIISEDVYSLKELNISLFKSHFGGEIFPLFRGEKYYNADYLRKRRQDLSEKFTEYYMGNKKL